MAKRINGEEIDDKIYKACVIACVLDNVDPFATRKVLKHDSRVEITREALSPGVTVSNAVHFTPSCETQYYWEQLIPDVSNFTRLHQACAAAGLIDSESQYALAACEWTEYGWEEDNYEWIQGGWHAPEQDKFGMHTSYNEEQWEVLKFLDEDKHGHPILAVLRRRS
jgi:hypothetical protein